MIIYLDISFLFSILFGEFDSVVVIINDSDSVFGVLERMGEREVLNDVNCLVLEMSERIGEREVLNDVICLSGCNESCRVSFSFRGLVKGVSFKLVLKGVGVTFKGVTSKRVAFKRESWLILVTVEVSERSCMSFILLVLLLSLVVVILE